MKYLRLIPSALLLTACASEVIEHPEPVFESFSYTGNDARYDTAFDPKTEYINPIISGTNPDPSICRQGNDFFMANSSFVYWPGIPVWHSRDLIDWDLCGYVLERPSQCCYKEGIRITGGAYAPDIKYCEANQTFYLIVTMVDGMGNVIFKTNDPYQGWSEPIPVPEVGGIDPSLLFDTDGKCYIVNNDAPAGPAQYDGHRAIWAREYDLKTDKVCGEPILLVDKGIDPASNPIWIEGPHLYHIANELEGRTYDRYYLMCAEGGTESDHSEVVLSGTLPMGPFEPCQDNPILTQRQLPHDRPAPVSCAGHADLVQVGSSSLNHNARNGEWWSVFLACTPYDGDQLCHTGRSTYLLPSSWRNNGARNGVQPYILSPDSAIRSVYPKSEWQINVFDNIHSATQQPSSQSIGSKADKCNLLTGNGSYTDSFDNGSLHPLWFTLRTPDSIGHDNQFANWYSLNSEGLKLQCRPVTLNELGQPSMVARWVKNSTFTAETTLLFSPKKPNSMSGLTLFQTEEAHYILAKRMNSRHDVEIVLLKTDKQQAMQEVAAQPLCKRYCCAPVRLRAELDQHVVQFSFSTDDGEHWQLLGRPQDADILTHNYTGAFTGCVMGLYAYGE
ncbi:MAG: glycoside hydrolase family 43 protein [Bacteroidales bacterium]|nr:glycoside hydrolase family 43 protein [Bacteroidales bacterium]